MLGALLSLGMITYVVYTAPGFALFPITLISQGPSPVSTVDSSRQALEHNRELQRRIEVRYQGTNRPMAPKDRRELEALQREERTLVRKARLAEEGGNRRAWWLRLRQVLRRFKITFGMLFLILSIIISVSMLLTLYPSIMKLLNNPS